MKILIDMKMTVQSTFRRKAFTLTELMIVILFIGVLAALTMGGLAYIKKAQYKSVARGEMEAIEVALENFKAKYGAYPPGNANLAGTYQSPVTNSLLPQLYYELSGTVFNGVSFVTLDGSSTINTNGVFMAYGVDGFVNCTKGSGEDSSPAKNFLPTLRQNQIYIGWTNGVAPTTLLVTSVGGPDERYHPLDPQGLIGPNPFRYIYPGVNNPNSYDLWVQLVIGGKTNLICNWSRQVILNSPLP
jgi:prepilin-type N-terminal cleavage/methylation domain-containing protein